MDTSRLLASYNNHIPTHQQPVGVGQHCQLRLGGHLTLTNITQQHHTNTPTHQHKVGVGQHVQLRLRGHLTLTSIIQQPHTNTSTSDRRGATRSAEAAWTPHAYKHHHLNQIATQLLDIKSQTDRQTDRQTERTVISIIPFTSYHSNLVSSPSRHIIVI